MATSPIETLDWFHPNVDRHGADAMLMANGQDGSYLIRKKRDSNGENYVLCVRCQNSVKHFEISYSNGIFKFGMGTFKSIEEFKKHFRNQPLVAGDNGVLTALKFAYEKNINELDIYDTVRVHCSLGREATRSGSDVHFSLASKEGYLTKVGDRRKSWKTRWFTLQKNQLCYYKSKTETKPIRQLDLRECTGCRFSNSYNKENCFEVVFPWRTFAMFATTREEAEQWIDMINFKLQTKGKTTTL